MSRAMEKSAISEQYFNRALLKLLHSKIHGAKTYGAISGALGGSSVGGTAGLIKSVQDQRSGMLDELETKEKVKHYLKSMLAGGAIGAGVGIPVGAGAGSLWRNALARTQRKHIHRALEEAVAGSNYSGARQLFQRATFKGVKHRPNINIIDSAKNILQGKSKKASFTPENTVITTGIHGDEKASRSAGKELSKHYNVVDVGNHSNNRKFKGKDLNRSFDDKYKPDVVRLAIKNIKSKNPKNIIDLHEDNEVAGAYAYASKDMEGKARDTLHRGTKLRLADKVKEDKVDRGVISDGKYPPKGSLVKEMEKDDISYILYETPTNIPLRDRINFHKEKVKQLFHKS